MQNIHVYQFHKYIQISFEFLIYFVHANILCEKPGFLRIKSNVDSMLQHCLRRWPNIEPALGQCIVFAGILAGIFR